MTNIGSRAAMAAAMLKPLGLSLLVSPDEFVITDKPDDPSETSIHYPTIEMVEAFIADHRRTARSAKPIEPRKPRVCDVVHYVSYGTPGGEYGCECRAAIITELTEIEVNEHNPAGDGTYRQTVGLCVLNPTGQFFNRGVLYAEGETLAAGPTNLCGGLYFPGGTWHWCPA